MFKKVSYLTAALLLLAYIVTINANTNMSGWLLMFFFLNLTLIFRNTENFKGFSFTSMIFAAVSLAMYYPLHFVYIGSFKLSALIIPLLQIIMFGMGSELSLKELSTVLKTPKTIAVGVICHYVIMPLIGFTIATV
jgi:BASS family bile acid:Na+ symporter